MADKNVRAPFAVNMMNRPWKIWLVFGMCLAVLLTAMGWVSLTAIRLDKAQQESQHQAEFEENVRLALWRMDSLLAPLIVQESSRPYFTYRAFFPAERAYNRMFSELKQEDGILLPSPLLSEKSSNVIVHFQLDPKGQLSSPQAPEGTMRERAEAYQYLNPQQIAEAEGHLAQLRQVINPGVLQMACLTNVVTAIPVNRNVPVPYYNAQQMFAGINSQAGLRQQAEQQQFAKNNMEMQARAQVPQQVIANMKTLDNNNAFAPGANMTEGMVTKLWFGDALVLARRVSVEGRTYIQGCWLNWPAIRGWLVENVKDLLPNAALTPLSANAQDRQGRMLASLPVRLVPGSLPILPSEGMSPIQLALIVAWTCVLVAAVAVALLLHGTVSLSERRGAFVSAVTHELRTPLTTFKMYSEMLAEGMVQDPEKEKSYLATLCSEANRLSHLVENVLAYARLERGSARRRVEKLTIGELIAKVKMRLLQRAEQAGMQLEVDSDEAVLATTVHVDTGAVEQILFNLVDNACKYAAPTAVEKIIHLEALPDGKFAMLRVRDHGQGISKEGAKRLFRPFSKSAHEAAHTAPGVGLGLALCRRLSRSMGGDLRLEQMTKEGACFVLTLPVSADGLGVSSASIT